MFSWNVLMNVLQAAPDLSRRSRGQEQNRTNAGLELDHTDKGSGGQPHTRHSLSALGRQPLCVGRADTSPPRCCVHPQPWLAPNLIPSPAKQSTNLLSAAAMGSSLPWAQVVKLQDTKEGTRNLLRGEWGELFRERGRMDYDLYRLNSLRSSF